ncbi:Acyl-CoA dehydrogenase [Tistlia consotensis]|uniref:3-methylmercaptopropionyl-CoA dehydrogenase n=1 Tax=Tistlia consotensis USBA 355 TaxID=560819 RepID=A0A1Y6B7G8_9PROT|nr:acyl-CoA dehydrogenase [Tistlia consotensis]SME97042.1 Acyl-CoA dehydrogenase [Tistlia consotensis USBA 355]SNR56464.1 Acyl-CoA dehydrogenase [Tistlia consotensis]
MTDYRAPIDEMRFVLSEVAGLGRVAALEPYAEATPELVEAVLEQAGRLAAEEIAPLNHPGDRTGSVFENGVVRTPEGFQRAYRHYVEGGWNALPFEPDWGGQGLPWALAIAVSEMWNSANMAFALCPLLTMGAVELLQAHGSAGQKSLYLSRLVSGEWTGTMNLTEPQAGSDVGALKTRAVPAGDGTYRITGQKIFITYGEHDLAENIVHMVLARTPDAPAGTKGISLFIVPKFLPDAEGRPGRRNDLRCASIEHKIGIKASPTCVMAYGDDGGATGFLVGQENRGMEYMFTMMNNARLAVGVQGVAIAERAYQQARDYARQRVQGRALGSRDPAPVAIIGHPDVRRTLLLMKSQTEAARALAYYTVASLDLAKAHPDPGEREHHRTDVVELLTPVVKSWCTDLGVEIASMGVQVHGGMGFIEETGAGQHYRDARINPIYEGTNGIQALDLVGRKIARLEGAPARAFAEEVRGFLRNGSDAGDDLPAIREAVGEGLAAFEAATDWLLESWARNPVEAATGASAYLRALGTLAGGWLLGRGAEAAARRLAEGDGGVGFLKAKIATARFYADAVLPQVGANAATAMRAADSTLALDEAWL